MNRCFKPFVKLAKKFIWLNAGALCRVLNRPAENGVLILQYHSISPLKARELWYIHPSLSIHPRDFERQMAIVRRYFEPVSLGRLLRWVDEGQNARKLPLAVTFDDGYRDNFTHAFPILRKYNIPATFYLTSECMDAKNPLWTTELRGLILNSSRSNIVLSTLACAHKLKDPASRLGAIRDIKARMVKLPRNQREIAMEEIRRETAASRRHTDEMKRVMLKWEHVERMLRCGMDFGAHTMTHPSLPHIPVDEAMVEIAGSRTAIEARIGRHVLHFCYPNPGDVPHFNARIQRILKNFGFLSAVTSIPGRFTWDADLLALKRKGIYRPYHRSPAEFFFWLQREALTIA
ncbi:MAG: polysaccharide deacetylase family protein [Deltaproteobacteria bacterium]|nr:polysaccharide deacetylase family protein [Deltaproteobacteria bacterium]